MDDLRKIVQEEIVNYMRQKQFTYSKIPAHEHTGVDSPKIRVPSLDESKILDGQSGGIISEALNSGQFIVQGDAQIDNTGSSPVLKVAQQPKFFTIPIPIIYGHGVGDAGSFSGGEAPNGTMVFFENASFSTLCIKTENGWYQFSPDVLP